MPLFFGLLARCAALLLGPLAAAHANEIKSRKLAFEHSEYVLELHLSTDGKLVFSESNSDKLLWDAATGQLVRRVDGIVFKFGRSPGRGTARLIADEIPMGGADRVTVRDVPTGAEMIVMERDESMISAPIHANLALLATRLSKPKEIRIWDVRERKIIRRIALPPSPPDQEFTEERAAVSPDFRWVAVAKSDTIELTDVATGAARSLRLPPSPTPVIGLDFDAGGRGWLLVARGRELGVWRVEDLAPVKRIAVGEEVIQQGVSIESLAGGDLVSVTMRRRTSLIHIPSGTAMTRFHVGRRAMHELRWLGGDLVVSTARARDIKPDLAMFTVGGSGFRQLYRRQDADPAWGTVALSPSGACLLLPSIAQKVARVLETRTGKEIARISAIKEDLHAAEWALDGTRLFAGGGDGGLYLIDMPKACHGAARR